MTKPLYFYNGTTFELVGPTTPQSPIAYQTSAPTAPATGDLWIDSDGDVDTYNRQLTRYYFVATASQTTITGIDANGLTLAYVAGSEAVYVNGALQVRGQDYTATNGTSITGLSALAVNDVVEIFAYTAFTVANAYTKAESDGLFATTTNFSATAWTSWTPTLSDITIGNGTVSAAYKQIGKIVFWEFRLVFGSTTSITGANSTLNLPVTGKRIVSKSMIGQMIDANGSIYPSGIGYWTNESAFYLGVINTSGTYGTLSQITSTLPFTWTTNDSITYSGVYEAA